MWIGDSSSNQSSQRYQSADSRWRHADNESGRGGQEAGLSRNPFSLSVRGGGGVHCDNESSVGESFRHKSTSPIRLLRDTLLVVKFTSPALIHVLLAALISFCKESMLGFTV